MPGPQLSNTYTLILTNRNLFVSCLADKFFEVRYIFLPTYFSTIKLEAVIRNFEVILSRFLKCLFSCFG